MFTYKNIDLKDKYVRHYINSAIKEIVFYDKVDWKNEDEKMDDFINIVMELNYLIGANVEEKQG